ncbi:MAG: hypothetical protein AB7G75_10895 [Candidatus Binatia bacterium]
MQVRGTVKGKIIELEEALPYIEGSLVRVIVEPEDTALERGSPVAVRQAIQQSPHLSAADVDALEDAIKAGQLPVHENTVFDEGR